MMRMILSWPSFATVWATNNKRTPSAKPRVCQRRSPPSMRSPSQEGVGVAKDVLSNREAKASRNNNLGSFSSCATIHRRSWDHLLSGKRPLETGRRLKPAPQLHSLLLRAA